MTGAVAFAALIAAPQLGPTLKASAYDQGRRPTPAAPAPPQLEDYKTEVSADIDRMYDFTQQMVDSVFSFGELGFQEFETQKYLTGILEKEGFTIEQGHRGHSHRLDGAVGIGQAGDRARLRRRLHPAGVAEAGRGVPRTDDRRRARSRRGSQLRRAAQHHGGDRRQADHAARQAVWHARCSGPALPKSSSGTKAYYVRAGVFKDVDVVLYNHVGSNLGTSWGDGGGNGLISVEYTFEGESAHSAGAPWRGRSAMDAVELMNVGWNYRREHLRTQQRSHYVVTNGGDQPNVVPRNASVWYYFRETSYDGIKTMWEIGDQHRQGRGDDDRHDRHVARARLGVAVAHEPHARRNDAREHRQRSGCRSGPKPT